MTQELHPLRVTPFTKNDAEMVDEKFIIAGLLKARDKTIAVMHEIRDALVIGLTEDEARILAMEISRKHGAMKHWHKPYIRFGRGTALTFGDPIQPDYKLRMNDPFYIDLGPIWPDLEEGLDYEGDVGDTFIFGENLIAEECALTARKIFIEGQEYWKKASCSGIELYSYIKQRTEHYGYILAENVDGHRLSDFSHHKYSKERLAQVNFVPQAQLWVLEVQIIRPDMTCGAFYEDIL